MYRFELKIFKLNFKLKNQNNIKGHTTKVFPTLVQFQLCPLSVNHIYQFLECPFRIYLYKYKQIQIYILSSLNLFSHRR